MLPLNYNATQAAALIDELTADNVALKTYDAVLPSQWQANPSAAAIQCLPVGDPPSYRLSRGDEEVIFRFVGAADDIYLPPFDKRRLNTAKLKYLQQSIAVSTMNSTSASREWTALTDVLDAMSRMVPDFVGDVWTPLRANTATFSNRVLSPSDDASAFAACSIPDIIDPTREMRTNANICGLSYTDDNVVEYMHIVDGKLLTVTPASFRRGDIVEARFSVVIFRVGDAKFVTKLLLRAIVNLDTSITRAAVRFTFEHKDSSRHTHLKRKRMCDQSNDKSLKAARLTESTRTGTEAHNHLLLDRSTAREADDREADDVEMGDSVSRVVVAAVAQGVSDMSISTPQPQ